MQLEHERLRTLYAVLAGIPVERLDLETFYGGGARTVNELLKTEHTCGTTACATGWAAIYPEFVEQGLKSNPFDNLVLYYDSDNHRYSDFNAMAMFFGMAYWDSVAVFGIKNEESEFTKGLEPHRRTSRRVALHRIRRFLLREKVITKKRSKELELQEEQQERDDVQRLYDIRYPRERA